MKKIFEDMTQYFVDRDVFCEAFYTYFTLDDYTWIASEHDCCTGYFLLKRIDDTFYIIHLPSGIIVSWYKHLGRCNECNKDNFTKTDLMKFFEEFSKEWKEYFNNNIKPKTPTVQEVHDKGPDVNSFYPTILLKRKKR